MLEQRAGHGRVRRDPVGRGTRAAATAAARGYCAGQWPGTRIGLGESRRIGRARAGYMDVRWRKWRLVGHGRVTGEAAVTIGSWLGGLARLGRGVLPRCPIRLSSSPRDCTVTSPRL
jgi:hypothetical protein